MRTTVTSVALLAAAALAWLATAGAASAAAGTYKVSACTAAEQFGHQTHAFADLSVLPNVKTGGMYTRRACETFADKPFGMVAGNILRDGRVRRGSQNGFVMTAPPGTSFVGRINYSGRARRRDCRYSIQAYALDAAGSAVKIRWPNGKVKGAIGNWLANHNCAKKRFGPSYAQAQQLGSAKRPLPFDLLGAATQIIQRTVCVGSRRKPFCTARSINRLQTWWADATVADNILPSANVVQDNPFTQGSWVSAGSQSVGYTASDNVGIKAAAALAAGAETGRDSGRACDYTQTVPCNNAPGRVQVDTSRLAEGTQSLVVRATDAADNIADSQPVTVRVDRTAPAAPAVLVDDGETWRSQNSFSVSWQNPNEGDRAPIAAAHWRLCRPDGSSCTTGTQAGTGIARLAGLRVPDQGEWTLRVSRRDGAGNHNADYASQPVRLRLDQERPALSFEPAPTDDPTRVSVAITEKISGITGGQVEIGLEGSNSWQALPTRLEGNRLVGHIDDAALAPGRWLLRAQASDAAGNVGVAAAPQPLTLPLRIQTALQAGVVRVKTVRQPVKGKKGRRGKRRRTAPRQVIELRPNARVRFGDQATIAGRLANREGNPLPGQQVRVLGPVAGGEQLLAVLTTDTQGGFSYKASGSASRTLRFVHAGTPTTLPAEARVGLVVPAAGSFKASRKRVRNGGRVVFRGRVRSLPVPATGKLVEVQVKQPTGEWTTFRTLRTDSQGRWRLRYRFRRTACHTRYRLRAHIPAEAGYPFAAGRSRTRSVLVRGAQGPCP